MEVLVKFKEMSNCICTFKCFNVSWLVQDIFKKYKKSELASPTPPRSGADARPSAEQEHAALFVVVSGVGKVSA